MAVMNDEMGVLDKTPGVVPMFTLKTGEGKVKTYSPPGQPSRHISQSRFRPCFSRLSRISGLVIPS